MSSLVIVYWRDIPAQVLVGRGRKAIKKPLSERFEQAIDRAAMKSGADQTDDYLAEWRKSDPLEIEGDAEKAANEWVQKLETEYDKNKLIALIENGGYEGETL